MEAISGESFSPYWLHGGHVLVNGRKMSKSKGNIVYLEDLLEQGYTPGYIRFFLIYRHYRERLDFTMENLERTAGILVSVKEMIRQLTSVEPGKDHTASPKARELIEGMEDTFREWMSDDLDVKGAVDSLRTELNRLMSLKMKGALRRSDAVKLRRILEKIDRVFQFLGR
jgi:cysteinyl-tRNA synthetase